MPDALTPTDSGATTLATFERLVRVETKLDVLMDQSSAVRIDHESRLRAIERVFWKTVGISAGIGAMFGAGGSYLLQRLTSG